MLPIYGAPGTLLSSPGRISLNCPTNPGKKAFFFLNYSHLIDVEREAREIEYVLDLESEVISIGFQSH